RPQAPRGRGNGASARDHQGRRSGASAYEPHRGRHAERQGGRCRTGCDLCRRGAALWRGARDRRPCRTSQGSPYQEPPVMTEALNLDHLRQWIGRSTEASDIVTAQLVKGLRATLFQDIGEPRAGDAAPWTTHWCLAQPVFPMSQLGPDGHPTRGGFLPPVPLPRRMWAGGEIEFFEAMRVGDESTRTSRLPD